MSQQHYQNIQKIANPVELVEAVNILLAATRASCQICTVTGEITEERTLPRISGEAATARQVVGYIAFGPLGEMAARQYFSPHEFTRTNSHNHQLTISSCEDQIKWIQDIDFIPAMYETITLAGHPSVMVGEALAVVFEDRGFLCEYGATPNPSHINTRGTQLGGYNSYYERPARLRISRAEFIRKWDSTMGGRIYNAFDNGPDFSGNLESEGPSGMMF